ncbi:hypothetical protein [Prevotella denticola]|uniref:hypothetical protein n=1 Tax=Prevotella denticola TaxID=28129 RepID=UPI003C761FAE
MTLLIKGAAWLFWEEGLCKAVLTVLRPCPDEKSAIVWRLGELSVTLQAQKWYHALSQMFNQ